MELLGHHDCGMSVVRMDTRDWEALRLIANYLHGRDGYVREQISVQEWEDQERAAWRLLSAFLGGLARSMSLDAEEHGLQFRKTVTYDLLVDGIQTHGASKP